MPPETSYRICRFPTPDDEGLCLSAEDGFYQMGRRGVERLTDVQWYTRHITVPIIINGQGGNAGRMLELLDIVDAPGSDAQGQGDFPKWKQKKNSYVFQLGTREIDVLMVCCSAETAAVQIGGQFQNDVWDPWVERCQGQSAGRLLLAFSHSSVLLADAERSLDSRPESSQANASVNSAQKIYKNTLQALMSTSATALVREGRLDSWPLLFFFESDRSTLQRYSEGFDAGADLVAKRLQILLEADRPAEEEQAAARPTRRPSSGPRLGSGTLGTSPATKYQPSSAGLSGPFVVCWIPAMAGTTS